MAYEQKSYAMAQRQALRERPTVAGSAPSARASMAKRNRAGGAEASRAHEKVGRPRKGSLGRYR
jgi:hypothetical protein